MTAHNDPQGLSIFDGAETGGFAVVLRGYDRIQVETHIRKLESALAEALDRAARGATAASDIESLRRDLAATQQRLAEAGNPTYAGLGEHVAQLLRTAEGQAHDLVTAANAEASAALQAARTEAEATLNAARAEAAATRESADEAARALREKTQRESDAARAAAAEESRALLAAAVTTDAELRRLAESDVATLRAQAEAEATAAVDQARRDTAQARAQAEADVTALRNKTEAEVEDLRRKATEEADVMRANAIALLNESRVRSVDETTALEAALRELRARLGEVAVPGAPRRTSPPPAAPVASTARREQAAVAGHPDVDQTVADLAAVEGDSEASASAGTRVA